MIGEAQTRGSSALRRDVKLIITALVLLLYDRTPYNIVKELYIGVPGKSPTRVFGEITRKLSVHTTRRTI